MILYRYILRQHAGPFIFSILTLMFIFLFNFLTKFADRLVGKGLGIWVITKLIAYNLAWMVVLVVPMAVLIATLMAYGNMSHNNEIAIMKASGISVYKMILPPFVVSIILGILLIQFNNKVYPDANHAARLLIHDISNKKPTLSLVPGLFSQEVANYSILVRDIDENTNTLKTVTIYDYSNPATLNVVTAETGRIYFSADQRKLVMDLNRGEIHESDPQSGKLYRKLIFSKHRIIMDAEQFSFQQSTPGGSRGDRELGAPEMMQIVDSLENQQSRILTRLNKSVERQVFMPFEDSAYSAAPGIMTGAQQTLGNAIRRMPGLTANALRQRPQQQDPGERDMQRSMALYQRLKERIALAQGAIVPDVQSLKFNQETIDSYLVEVHKKYSLPAACVIFILIGAPLGIMTRKGGLGVAAGISILFFLIYWAFLIGGEKLADRGLLSPFWGMWSANFVLGILGIILTIKTARETVILDLSALGRLLPKQLRGTEEETDNETD